MRNKNINGRTDGRRNLLGVPAFVKASQKHEITFISFAQLNNKYFILIQEVIFVSNIWEPNTH